MTRITMKPVEYICDGKKIKTVTDAETAHAIDVYNTVYNNIQNFKVSVHIVKSKHPECVCDAIVAKSDKMQIACIKEYVPNIPECLASAQYKCGILDTTTNKFEPVIGGVQILYYKLLCGRIK